MLLCVCVCVYVCVCVSVWGKPFGVEFKIFQDCYSVLHFTCQLSSFYIVHYVRLSRIYTHKGFFLKKILLCKEVRFFRIDLVKALGYLLPPLTSLNTEHLDDNFNHFVNLSN